MSSYGSVALKATDISSSLSIEQEKSTQLKEMEQLKCLGCAGFVTTRLCCPTCIGLGLLPSIFCSQDCFNANWNSHKGLHKAARDLISGKARSLLKGYESLKAGVNIEDKSTWKIDEDLSRFDGYLFTGSLLPWPRTSHRTVPFDILKPDYYLTGVPEEEKKSRESRKIVVRTREEISKLRTACRIGREALDLAHSMITPGVSGDDIDKAIHEFIISKGAYPSPLNYNRFPKSCCISVNEVICHGIPDLRPLKEGDIVNVDITVYKDGFHGDLNETFLCGNVDEESKLLVKAAYESMMRAIGECRPGMLYREIGDIISKTVEDQGFSVVRTYCGHGIGTLFHTSPSIPHYRRNKAVGAMKPGHAFTIEPMINAGVWKDQTWPDAWTSVTVDGKRSAQFEHTVVVTDTGVEILTCRLPTSPPLKIDVLSEDEYLNCSHRRT